MKVIRYFLLAFIIIVIDQTSKMLVFNNMYLHEEINVLGNWFRIHYLLNPGMAFGIRWENEFGKLALTFFRIIAMFGISWYLVYMARKEMHAGFLWCMALILGGAVGNVIDSIFYGVLLGNAPADAPTAWFHGQVIDMLYFPIFEFVWPEWVPFVGGSYFEFFSPVFNIADSSIFMGVLIILVMQKRFFPQHNVPEQESASGSESDQSVVQPEESVATALPTEEQKPDA
ncbi:MAG: lipoprotein signal peptidase [Cyclobacteriaceae bacterium]|jgi:signal peptidase II|nr:lipoprotein signal peptidase [Cyclobacteriaceae bacterium]